MSIFSTRAKIGSAIARHNGNVLEHSSLRVPLGSQTIPKPTAPQVLLLPTLDSQKSSANEKQFRRYAAAVLISPEFSQHLHLV